ncbi:hypothetical protein [Enterobacter hormaechei]
MSSKPFEDRILPGGPGIARPWMTEWGNKVSDTLDPRSPWLGLGNGLYD